MSSAANNRRNTAAVVGGGLARATAALALLGSAAALCAPALPNGAPSPASQLIARTQAGRTDVPRVELASRLADPTKRGVTVWVETTGIVYWSTAENAIPTHGDGANRNDNKYIDNSKTYRTVIRTNTIGVEFNGNAPDVTVPPTPAQVKAWP